MKELAELQFGVPLGSSGARLRCSSGELVPQQDWWSSWGCDLDFSFCLVIIVHGFDLIKVKQSSELPLLPLDGAAHILGVFLPYFMCHLPLASINTASNTSQSVIS